MTVAPPSKLYTIFLNKMLTSQCGTAGKSDASDNEVDAETGTDSGCFRRSSRSRKDLSMSSVAFFVPTNDLAVAEILSTVSETAWAVFRGLSKPEKWSKNDTTLLAVVGVVAPCLCATKSIIACVLT